jgi:hypothetical protein
MHDCGNNRCCNPDHLILGNIDTRGLVMQQHKAAGITPSGVPYNKRKYKYTAEEVRWIRTASTTDISQRYNITRGLASTIRTNLFKTYQWVK